MPILRIAVVVVILESLCLLTVPGAAAQDAFKAGFAKRDITPQAPMPMWGYGDRKALLSNGVLDPLYAKAVVIQAGDEKIAIVGLDLGRSPRPDSIENIRKAVAEASGVEHLLLVGSHTHHGPVLELKDEPGKGGEKFPDAVAYVAWLDRQLIDVINEAASDLKNARIGWAAKHIDMNRNRHSKIEPKPRDTELAVIRIDSSRGKPIAVLANFAAHPTNIPAQILKFSADYPGAMMDTVEQEMDTNCIFLQGAAGDMSCKKGPETDDYLTFGAALGEHVIHLAKDIDTKKPETPRIQAAYEDFAFQSRLPFDNPIVVKLFENAFFPELAHASLDDVAGNTIRPTLSTVMLNNELALVGGSGEFFSSHAIRLKERSRAPKTLFLGYCNGHNMYFPTIEAAAEGGYGGDATVSWVEVGAGERMMNTALETIYRFMGAYKLPGIGD